MKDQYIRKFLEFEETRKLFTDWNKATEWFHCLVSDLTDIWWNLTDQVQKEIEKYLESNCFAAEKSS